MDKVMKAFTDSQKRIVGMGIAMFVVLGVLWYIYLGEGDPLTGWQVLGVFSVFLFSGYIFLLKVKMNKIVSIVFYALLPVISFLLVECFSHNPFEDITPAIMFLNILLYFVFFFMVLAFFGSTKIGGWIGLAVPMLFAIVNYFVVSFRSSPIVPWDIYSIRTAASVADNYNFSVDFRFLIVIATFLLLFSLTEKTTFTFKKIPLRMGLSTAALILLCVYGKAIQTDKVEEVFQLNGILFTPNEIYKDNGFMVSFLWNLKYLKVEKPSGYSADKVDEIIEQVDGGEILSSAFDISDAPNIIVVMNEAYSDLAVIGDFETNEDYMPFVRSLTENTVKGEVYVSVKGGNTANTEFEFLTGNTLAFLPAGSVAYQQYIHDEMPSMASQLGALGYNTVGIHPFNASGWARDEVYPNLGFDESYFRRNFDDPEYLRSYVSDRATYKLIQQLYEEKEEQDKMFFFDVTMQNHGGYFRIYDDFETPISLTEDVSGGAYTEQYLTLIKESDVAFEELVQYFENQDEETIILMFGDHQPADYVTEPIYELNGVDMNTLTLEEEQNQYAVPFVIWANFDIDEQEGVQTSVNYLGSLLLEAAGIPLSGYQEYLKQLRETLPVITGNVYVDKEGKYYPAADDTYEEILYDYSVLQYNSLVDGKNRRTSFFQGGKE